MIETFVRLVDGRNEAGGTSSLWQGILRFQTNVSINQLVVSTIQQAGRAAANIDPQSQNWRFLLYNHKFGEYCDTNSRDKRAVCDGDKFQLVFVPKNLSQISANNWIAASQPTRNRATAEIQNQTPLIFLDEENEDVKPSIDTLIRQTTNSILTAATNQAIINDHQNMNGREIRRGSTRHLSTDLIRQLENDFDDDEIEEEDEENSLDSSPQRPKLMRLFQQQQENGHGVGRKRQHISNNNNNNEEYDSEEDPMFKPTKAIYRRNSSIVSEKSLNGHLEDGGPCSAHLNQPSQCSHTKFKNVDALGILGSVSSGQAILEHLESLSRTEGTAEIEHGIRCKLMNAIGTYLMHNADTIGLPTAVERRILVHSFLNQLPCQIDPSVFTNRGGTGCLDYWVRNRRKTTVREDGVYMVRGSKARTQRGGKRSTTNY